MKIAWKLHIVDGKPTLPTGDNIPSQGSIPAGQGVVSIGPGGREDDRPLGTAGAYEVCRVVGATLVFNPTPDSQYILIPE